ncbi:hypothetical protein J4426_01575 [Candidatus Woesearchaeota archaeon]|nr:hypothetical protein [Candidatus Woesearchaeota archaeon]
MTRIYITPSAGLKIRYQGITDFGNLYKYMKLWLEDRGFADEKKLETKYTERRFGDRKNLEIMWNCSTSISNYVSYQMQVTFLVLGLTETEVQIGDIKRKLDKGDFELRIIGYVKVGEGEWNDYTFLERVYYNLVVRKRIEEYKQDYYIILYKFVGYIKEFLGLRG